MNAECRTVVAYIDLTKSITADECVSEGVCLGSPSSFSVLSRISRQEDRKLPEIKLLVSACLYVSTCGQLFATSASPMNAVLIHKRTL